MNIAFFLSSTCSTAQIAIEYILNELPHITIKLFVFDSYNSKIYKTLKDKYNNISKHVFIEWKDRINTCNEINDLCINHKVQWIFLAFNKLLQGDILTTYHNKIINFHPSLLPAYKGFNAIENSFNDSVCFMGCTSHFITQNIDDGKIICQGIYHKDNQNKSIQLNRFFYILCISLTSSICLITNGHVKYDENTNKIIYENVIYDNIYVNPAPRNINKIIAFVDKCIKKQQ